MNLIMIQDILEKVENKKLYVKNTSSSDCNLLESNSAKDINYIICKSFIAVDDYLWKIVELDEWGMINEKSETYYEKNKEEFKVLEKIHENLQFNKIS